jgi:hypothetical protein
MRHTGHTTKDEGRVSRGEPFFDVILQTGRRTGHSAVGIQAVRHWICLQVPYAPLGLWLSILRLFSCPFYRAQPAKIAAQRRQYCALRATWGAVPWKYLLRLFTCKAGQRARYGALHGLVVSYFADGARKHVCSKGTKGTKAGQRAGRLGL